MTASEPWTCPTCNGAISTAYCPLCGERALCPRDLTLHGLFDQVAKSCTHIDGRVIRSFLCLVTRPGALTVAYLKGQRKSYIAPFQLFLIVNVLFFGMQSLTGTKVFSTPLDKHLHNQFWSGIAQKFVQHRLETMQTTLDLYLPVFDQAVALNAKSLILLMALSFALLLPAVFYRSRCPFVMHLVFSLHFYAFLLLLFCITLAGVAVQMFFGGIGLGSESLDHALSIILLVACASYLYLATETVYGTHGAARFLKVVALTLGVACIVLGYRFVLLPITLYST